MPLCHRHWCLFCLSSMIPCVLENSHRRLENRKPIPTRRIASFHAVLSCPIQATASIIRVQISCSWASFVPVPAFNSTSNRPHLTNLLTNPPPPQTLITTLCVCVWCLVSIHFAHRSGRTRTSSRSHRRRWRSLPVRPLVSQAVYVVTASLRQFYEACNPWTSCGAMAL